MSVLGAVEVDAADEREGLVERLRDLRANPAASTHATPDDA